MDLGGPQSCLDNNFQAEKLLWCSSDGNQWARFRCASPYLECRQEQAGTCSRRGVK